MKRIILAALVGVLVSGPAPALADAAENFVKFFSINCIRTVENLDALAAYAKLMKWKEVSPELMAIAGPKPKHSWGVRQDGQFFIIASGSGQLDGQIVNSCAVLSKPHEANDVARVLRHRFKLKLIVDEIEGWTRYQQFSTVVGGVPLLISIISGDDPNVKLINLSAQYISRAAL